MSDAPAADVQDALDLETLSQATVIGMTTTKAAKYQHLLRRLGVKVRSDRQKQTHSVP
jgi:hypothetical protein